VAGGLWAKFRMKFNDGKIRVGLLTPRKERNSGREPSSVFGGDCAPRSSSSQQKVTASPFGSLPVAVSANGVCRGIVKFDPAFTSGGALPLAAVVAHVAEALM